MQRTTLLVTIAAALILGACGDGSALPVATGKANIRGLNAIKTAPEVAFKIEERVLGTVTYRQITETQSYDDINYTFNFDVFYAGDDATTRIASQNLDIVADMDYILVLTGTLSDPAIIVWETAEREFADTETVFEARFAHTADSLGSVDFYFAAAGIAPAAGTAVGTLAFGDELTSVDFEAGEYVFTITTSGMPGDILYESIPITYAAATQFIISPFDGDANVFAPVIGRAFASAVGSSGGSITLSDVNYPPTVEFVNGSLAMGSVDIYADELLTSMLVANHMYRGVAAELPLAAGDNPVYYTPTGLTSPVLIESTIGFFGGLRGRVVAYGPVDALETKPYVPDRRSVETHAKLGIFNAAQNFEFISVYVMDAGTTIEDTIPIRPAFPAGSVAPVVPLAPGSYDIYVTEFLQTEILAGPIRIDVALGDVLSGIIFDTVDPAVLALDFLPINP